MLDGTGYRCAPYLRGQAEAFVRRKAFADCVDLLDEVHRALPDYEITEGFAVRHARF
jgi:hypothetical protein